MRVDRTGEFGLIRRLRDLCGRRGSRFVVRGIGDDAAVLGVPRDGRLLFTADALAEGVHFDLSLLTPYQIGFRAAVSNVSDIHAMGGRALAATISIGIRRSTEVAFVEDLYRGLLDGFGRYGAEIAGGDTVKTDALFLSVALLGTVGEPVCRDGAVPGQGLFVLGALGESALGLEILRKIGAPIAFEKGEDCPAFKGARRESVARLIRAHVLPELPPVPPSAGAMIDVSDGLAGDAAHLAAESGTGMVIRSNAVPVARDAESLAEALGRDAQELVFGGGEDYALLFTLDRQRRPPRGAVEIGEILDAEAGLTVIDGQGEARPLRPDGWDHFGPVAS